MLSKQMAYLMLQLLICPNFENPITFVYSFKSILFFFLFLFKHSNYLNYFLTVFSYLQFETHQKQKPKKHFLFYSLFVSWVLFLVLLGFFSSSKLPVVAVECLLDLFRLNYPYQLYVFSTSIASLYNFSFILDF